jgi:hypothetical protein
LCMEFFLEKQAADSDGAEEPHLVEAAAVVGR